MSTTRLLLVLAAWLVAGCSAGEIVALENELAARRSQRDQLVAIAEHLNEAKKDLESAKKDLARVSLWRSDGDPAMRMSALSGRLGGARASYAKDGTDWKITLTGTGGAPGAMTTLERIQGPGFVVTRIDAGASAWTAELRTRNVEDAGPAASPAAAPGPSALPPPGLFPSRRGAALRAEIAALDHEIAELQKLVGEMAKMGALREKIDRELAALEQDPARLGRVLAAAQPLFLGRTPLLASGTVSVAGAGYEARGIAAPGVTGESFASRKPAGWELRKLEGTSIELSFSRK